ncbi:AN1-type zinc finger protein 1, variant 2 [Entomophthora muscae]|uniref:AN1-type zinc finger protein 1, variant 2 n=1 Tax=Entomophthora muscae TaxID=34485 RepID=A0ACC2RV43_9FUNG|nr:AN1-type zinc finger protein 1, variant 2 [Entomophthora muscae]
MELPGIGSHCSISECKQLDFLPLKCNNCQVYFCSNHFKTDLHACNSISNFTENPEYSQPNFQCPISGCHEKGTIGSECPDCLETYCLKHRTPKSHTCDKRPVMIKRAEEESIIESKRLATKAKLLEKVKQSTEPSNVPKNQPKLKFSGSNSLSPTIIKMIAKKKAKGDAAISMPARIYFEVASPVSYSLEPHIYVSVRTGHWERQLTALLLS